MLQAALEALQDLRDILENEIGRGRASSNDGRFSDRSRHDDALRHTIEHLRLL